MSSVKDFKTIMDGHIVTTYNKVHTKNYSLRGSNPQFGAVVAVMKLLQPLHLPFSPFLYIYVSQQYMFITHIYSYIKSKRVKIALECGIF